MTKYSYEFKKKAVMEYINGKNGYRRICKDYNIPDKHILREWVDKYKKFGDDGLRRSREKKKYTFEFKLSVVESYLTTEVSYRELAMSVGISNPAIISNVIPTESVARQNARLTISVRMNCMKLYWMTCGE